jgi:TPR repeat protein
MKKIIFALLIAVSLSTATADPQAEAAAASVRGDYSAELKITRPLATSGVAWAQSFLGDNFFTGSGAVRNYKEAVKWYRLAAVQGDGRAQFMLGVAFENGQGVVQDYKKAHIWFNLAAVTGDSFSAKARDIVAQRMTAEQIGEAQTMARHCIERKFKGCD